MAFWPWQVYCRAWSPGPAPVDRGSAMCRGDEIKLPGRPGGRSSVSFTLSRMSSRSAASSPTRSTACGLLPNIGR